MKSIENRLFVSATGFEVSGLIKISKKISDNHYKGGDFELFVSGIGAPVSIYNLTRFLSQNNKKYHIINIGIAGSFSEKYEIGNLVEVKSDNFADLGIDDNGNFISVFEAGLIDSNEYPFSNSELFFDTITKLPAVKAVTSNTVTGSNSKKQMLINKYEPAIETMEGCAIAYVAKQFCLKISQIRAISNKVEIRNKKNWDIELAINKLNGFLLQRI